MSQNLSAFYYFPPFTLNNSNIIILFISIVLKCILYFFHFAPIQISVRITDEMQEAADQDGSIGQIPFQHRSDPQDTLEDTADDQKVSFETV